MTDDHKSNMKEVVVVGLFWKFAERIGIQFVQFIIQLILARLLMPSDFGTIAIINVIILVANVLVQYGFSTALIQKKEADDIDYSSVFYANIVISTIMYVLIFIAAPWLSVFYEENLTLLIRVQSIILIFSAISGVQNAILSRKMDFKRSFFINLGAILVQGSVGLLLSLRGYGIWSLVYSQISNAIVLVLFGFLFVKWRPTLKFSFYRIKTMFEFGKNILLASLIETVFTNIYSLIIGKVYTKELLGFYNRGQSIPSMLITTVNGSIQGVLFPAFSSKQDESETLKMMMRRSMKLSSYLIFPIMFGIIAISNQLILVLLTEKWLPAVPFLQLSCIAMAFYPIHTTNLQAISAVGRSDIYLKLELLKKALLVAMLIISLRYGIYAVMFGNVMCSLISTVINAWPNKKLFNYSILEQIRDVFPSMLLSIMMGIGVYVVGEIIHKSNVLELFIQILVGMGIYIIGSIICKFFEFTYIVEVLKRLYKK